MAITTAAKFEYDIVAVATTLKIPPIMLKQIIQKLFSMQGWRPIPDKVSFIEISKLGLTTVPVGPVLLNSVNTMTIGLRQGQGTDAATVTDYLCKAAKSVVDLSPWAATMDARLK